MAICSTVADTRSSTPPEPLVLSKFGPIPGGMLGASGRAGARVDEGRLCPRGVALWLSGPPRRENFCARRL
jgi:hypothetical protein